MRQKIRLTESELNSLIMESVVHTLIEEGLVDESVLGNLGRGLKSAFGKDFKKMTTKAQAGLQTAGNAMASGAKAAGKAMSAAGKAVTSGAKAAGKAVTSGAKAVRRGAQDFGQDVQDRYNDLKIGYRSGQQNDRLNKIKGSLQQMLSNGTLGTGRVAQSAQEFIGVLDQAIRNNNTAARNPRGIQGNRFRIK